MKVAVFLADRLAPAAGGNFSYYDRLVRAIDDHNFAEPIELCFTGRNDPDDFKLKKSYVRLTSPWLHNLFMLFRKTDLTGVIRRRFSINIDLANRVDVERLRKNRVDLILVPKQFAEAVDNVPFMTINWDAAHKSSYAFPEFIDDYVGREDWFRTYIQKGLSVIVESEASKEEFHRYYAISKSKLEVVPLFPGGVVEMNVAPVLQAELLGKFDLVSQSYFFYPAQFWGHKNHYNLVLAFGRLLSMSGRSDLKLVLTGSDKGNKDYIRRVIKDNNLESNVSILGFVSNEEMFTLYKNATALVMPTFLGPTNMPVLEAAALETAVICSDLAGHRETCGNGAIYVDPTNQEAWANAMLGVLDIEFRTTLIQAANRVQANSIFNIQDAIVRLESVLEKYIRIRKAYQ